MRSSSLKIGTCFVYVLAPWESDFGGGIGGGEGCAGCGVGVGSWGSAALEMLAYIHTYMCMYVDAVRA